ncbi:caprin-2-like [Engraulis encrasicolus]|uniref:caprin-2-like n=1 Tax=Engraulis encrasicolus TaxID=184585 RepID=UPI002FD4D085
MRAAISLLVLLFSMRGALTQSFQAGIQSAGDKASADSAEDATPAAVDAPGQLDVSAELKELRDMVVELRITLRLTQDELTATQDELKVTQAELTTVKTRQITSEAEISTLKQLTTEQKADPTQAEAKLNMLDVLENPKVAFSVGLLESHGEIHADLDDMDLVYSKIFTNIGEAYDEMTGFFTAPVKGVYYFRFTGTYYANRYGIGLMMYKNEEKVMYLYDYKTDGRFAYLSSGLPMQLEAGDKVHMRLQGASRIYDDEDNHSTFSGFLIFPL